MENHLHQIDFLKMDVRNKKKTKPKTQFSGDFCAEVDVELRDSVGGL